MTSSMTSLFYRSSLRVVLLISVAVVCFQMAADAENVTTEATVTDSVRVEHHAIVAAGNQTSAPAKSKEPAPVATKAPPATGSATSIMLTSSTMCLLTVVGVAIARLF